MKSSEYGYLPNHNAENSDGGLPSVRDQSLTLLPAVGQLTVPRLAPNVEVEAEELRVSMGSLPARSILLSGADQNKSPAIQRRLRAALQIRDHS